MLRISLLAAIAHSDRVMGLQPGTYFGCTEDGLGCIKVTRIEKATLEVFARKEGESMFFFFPDIPYSYKTGGELSLEHESSTGSVGFVYHFGTENHENLRSTKDMLSVLGKGLLAGRKIAMTKNNGLMGIKLKKTFGEKIDWIKTLEGQFSLSEANRLFLRSLASFPSKALAATRSNCRVKPLSKGKTYYGCKADGCLKLVVAESDRIAIERFTGDKFIYLPSIKFSLDNETGSMLRFKIDRPGLMYDMASHAVQRHDGLEESLGYVCRNTIEFLGYRLSADELPPVDWLAYLGEKKVVLCDRNREFFNTRFSLSLKRLLGSACPRIDRGVSFAGSKEALAVKMEVIASGVANVEFKFESAQGIRYIVAFAQTKFSFDEDTCRINLKLLYLGKSLRQAVSNMIDDDVSGVVRLLPHADTIAGTLGKNVIELF